MSQQQKEDKDNEEPGAKQRREQDEAEERGEAPHAVTIGKDEELSDDLQVQKAQQSASDWQDKILEQQSKQIEEDQKAAQSTTRTQVKSTPAASANKQGQSESK